jgi:hypothetical protein
VTWDGSKRGRVLENKEEEKKMKSKVFFGRRIGRIGGTCDRKSHTLF